MLKILQNNEVEVSGEVSDGTYFIVYKDTVTPLTPPTDMALIEAVDTIATLTALIKEAGEALEGIDSEYYVGDYRRAAEIRKKIQEALP